MANVKIRFACHSDDRRIIDVQLLSRASVQRESGSRPSENPVTDKHHLGFAGISQTTIPGLWPVTATRSLAVERPVQPYVQNCTLRPRSCGGVRTSFCSRRRA
jgi:hypothetical protein